MSQHFLQPDGSKDPVTWCPQAVAIRFQDPFHNLTLSDQALQNQAENFLDSISVSNSTASKGEPWAWSFLIEAVFAWPDKVASPDEVSIRDSLDMIGNNNLPGYLETFFAYFAEKSEGMIHSILDVNVNPAAVTSAINNAATLVRSIRIPDGQPVSLSEAYPSLRSFNTRIPWNLWDPCSMQCSTPKQTAKIYGCTTI
jgi:hypothetical protein